MEKLKIGIVGSRRRNSDVDFNELLFSLNKFLEDENLELDDIVFVSGGCPKGGDKFAEMIASAFNIPIIIHLPDKSKLPEKPMRWDFAKINYDRNTLIAQDADVLFAVVAEDRKGGTEDTVKKYLKMGKTRLVLV